MVVKRYRNRRLYDTDESRYVTVDEVAEKVRLGADVQVIDAPSGDDITQSLLAQIILESRRAAALLPVPLLYQLIRMGDDALAEFFGRYVTWALQVYLKVREGARSMVGYHHPLGAMTAGELLSRLFAGAAPWGTGPGDAPFAPPFQQWADIPRPPGPDRGAETRHELAALRREIEGLKAALKSDAQPPPDDEPGQTVRSGKKSK